MSQKYLSWVPKSLTYTIANFEKIIFSHGRGTTEGETKIIKSLHKYHVVNNNIG